ncbi:hypothetical protein [Saccharothrix sp. ST-888]|uniref:hypothetical protein n=1 Tax=Saccharothrix sp. ST-888 TaxID=1427391 RepID=UPI0005EC8615|nr:hypothetical protein [Saccharothrix sp. ST-888]KJK57681.1 hypothetical protein UK12_14965 [Saccharothrix sp. ST-888]
MSEFIFRAVPEMVEYFSDMADEMVQRFGISRAEAVARINESWKDDTFDSFPHILCHEFPEHWAYLIYYGDVPYWDEDADRSTWVASDPPPADSPAWTLPREPEQRD